MVDASPLTLTLTLILTLRWPQGTYRRFAAKKTMTELSDKVC